MMDESVDIEAVRAEALRKLGRNIVNFSKIEAAFKHLLLVSQLEVTEGLISEQVFENQIRSSRHTLGMLVHKFNKEILGDFSQAEPTMDSPRVGISSSLKVTYSNPDSLEAQKCALARIVAERNKLIHQDLAFLDTSSVEDYHQLTSLLNEQNPRLLAQLEELGKIIRSMGECWQALEDLSKSPDFSQWIQSDQVNT